MAAAESSRDKDTAYKKIISITSLLIVEQRDLVTLDESKTTM